MNISSRICNMADHDQVFISQSTYEKVKLKFLTRQIGFKQLKGKEKQVMIHEVLALRE